MYNRVYSGRKSGIGPSGVPIMESTDLVAIHGLQLYANVDNTDTIWVGNDNLTADSADNTDGFPLIAGDAFFMPIRHPDNIYVRSSTLTDQKLWWVFI